MNPECVPFVEQGDIFNLLNSKIDSGEQYDVVWLGHVLEHVLDPINLMTSLHSLLSRDGLLVVTVPNDGSDYHEWLFESGRISNRWWIAVPDHISYFTSESLHRTAIHTGWECLAMLSSFPVDWFLSHEGSNYVADASKGALAHQARLSFEQLIGKRGSQDANRFYEALSGIGMGRDITAYLRPRRVIK